jgi:PAS domain S-box-containing protein
VERLGPVVRLSLGLVILTSSVLVLVDLVGLVPDASNVVLESRIRLSETLATQLTPAAERNDLFLIRKVLGVTVARNEDVLSGGLRAASGRLMVSAGDHRELWNPEDATRSSATHVRLPLFQSGKKWGTVELRFRGSGSTSLLIALWDRPLLRLVLAVAVLGFALYMLYMRRTLRHLDPSAVIPSRVQHALDVMTEGVLLIDEQERIVLANSAFAERLDRTPTSLLGVKVSKLDWKPPDAQGARLQYPWLEAIRDARTSTGTALRIETKAGAPRSFAVNASPVLDGWERPKGAIVTFDDVTLLEQKTAALEAANIELEKSRDEIYFHAEEMEVLARRDPLTGVANRRAFMEGDDVIRRVAKLFADEVRGSDSVCRYGGEEFCIAFPGAAVDAAARVAERLREKVGAPGFAEVPVKMSFGVVSSESGATTLSELLDQADKALYASKEGGRDRVTRWDAIAAGSPSARDRAE